MERWFPLSKILSLEYIPISLEIGTAWHLIQWLEHLDIVRICLLPCRIIVYIRESEGIIVRILIREKLAIDKKPLDPGMSDPSRISTREYTRPDVWFRCSDTRLDEIKHIEGPVLELVDTEKIKLRPLILVYIVWMIRMTKEDDWSVRESHDMFGLVVFVCADCELLQEWTDDRGGDFFVCATEDRTGEIWSGFRYPHGLHSVRFRLSSSHRTTKKTDLGWIRVKCPLFWMRDIFCHRVEICGIHSRWLFFRPIRHPRKTRSIICEVVRQKIIHTMWSTLERFSYCLDKYTHESDEIGYPSEKEKRDPYRTRDCESRHSSDDIFHFFCHIFDGKGANFASDFFRLFVVIFVIFSLLLREFVSFDELWEREIHREYVMIDGSGVFDFRFLWPLLHDLEE